MEGPRLNVSGFWMTDICFVTKVWRGGGTAWVAQNVARYMAEAGCKVTYVAPLSEPLCDEPVHVNLTRVIVPREILRGQAGSLARAWASVRRIAGALWAVLRERRRTANFAFSIPEPLAFTIPLFIVLRLAGARVIFLVHDAVPHAWRLPPGLRFVERCANRVSYRLASILVVMSSALQSALVREFGIDAAKIRIIPHGLFHMEGITPIPGDGRLLQFGKIRSNKNVLEVIRGVSLARRTDQGVRLVIAGQPYHDEQAYWTECLREISRDPDGFDLRIAFVDDAALPALVSEVDAFILAYDKFDSQSGVGVLAGSCGRPVIATHSGGLSELASHGLRGEFLQMPVTAENIAAAILAFRARPVNEWRDEAGRGAEQLKDAMSWPRIGRAWRDLIAERDAFISSAPSL